MKNGNAAEPDLQSELTFQHQSICRLISLAERAITRNLQLQFRNADFKITVPQWRALYFLSLYDGQPQQAIATYTGSDKTAITRLINGLESRGLIKRVSSKDDRRSKLVWLTAKGRRLQEQLLQHSHRTIDLAECGISKNQLEKCIGVLNKVMSNLDGKV